jgi:hypothetical protein
MAGLDPAIQSWRLARLDARVEPAHDGANEGAKVGK